MERAIAIPSPVGKANSRLDVLAVVFGQRRVQDGTALAIAILSSEPHIGG